MLKLDWGCQQKLVLWSFASLTSIACIYTWVCMAKTFFYIMSTVANRLNLNLFYIQLSYRYDIPENYFHFVLTFYSLSLSFSVDDHPVLKADSIKYIIIFRNMVSCLRISYRMFFSLLLLSTRNNKNYGMSNFKYVNKLWCTAKLLQPTLVQMYPSE